MTDSVNHCDQLVDQLVTATDSANPHVINGLRSPSELVIGERIC